MAERSKTGAVLAVVHKGAHSLGFYDFADGTLLDEVAVAPYPHEAALTPDRRHICMCHFGVALAEDEGPGGHAISVVNVKDRTLARTIDCAPYNKPHGIDVADDGTIYAVSEGTSNLLIVDGDRIRAVATGGLGSHIVTVLRDGRRGFVSNMWSDTVSILNTNGAVDAPAILPVGVRPEGSVLDSKERFLYVTCRQSATIAVIDTLEVTVARQIPTPPGPVRLTWDDAGRLLVALYYDQSLLIVVPESGDVAGRVALPHKPVAVSFDPVSRSATLSTLGDRVYVVDLERLSVDREIATKADPDPTFVLR